MYAVLAAQRAEDAALNARCAAYPREAANYAARLRRTPHANKAKWLFNSTICDHSTLARLLLADGVSLNTVDAENRTPLHAAAETGAIHVLRILLEAGADTSCCDNFGKTLLAGAVRYGNVACARELIPHTDLRIFNADGVNVLHVSITANEPEILKLLLPHFADDIDVRTIKPRTPADPGKPYSKRPLYFACDFGYHAMVKTLLAAGASRTAHRSDSFSCLHAAAENGHLACVTLLIGRPDSWKMSAAELDARDAKGRTPLFLAAMMGHRYCCAALLAAGADPGAASHKGRTALDAAKHAAKHNHPGNQDLVELLECRGGGPAPLLCAGCGASDKRLHACSVCQSAAFCSQSCFNQAYSAHREECERIKAVNEEKARNRTRNKATTPAPP